MAFQHLHAARLLAARGVPQVSLSPGRRQPRVLLALAGQGDGRDVAHPVPRRVPASRPGREQDHEQSLRRLLPARRGARRVVQQDARGAREGGGRLLRPAGHRWPGRESPAPGQGQGPACRGAVRPEQRFRRFPRGSQSPLRLLAHGGHAGLEEKGERTGPVCRAYFVCCYSCLGSASPSGE